MHACDKRERSRSEKGQFQLDSRDKISKTQTSSKTKSDDRRRGGGTQTVSNYRLIWSSSERVRLRKDEQEEGKRILEVCLGSRECYSNHTKKYCSMGEGATGFLGPTVHGPQLRTNVGSLMGGRADGRRSSFAGPQGTVGTLLALRRHSTAASMPRRRRPGEQGDAAAVGYVAWPGALPV